MITAGASSPPCRSSAAVSAFVDSASPGRNDSDSLSCESVYFSGTPAPNEAKMTANQTKNTIHLARGPARAANNEVRLRIPHDPQMSPGESTSPGSGKVLARAGQGRAVRFRGNALLPAL